MRLSKSRAATTQLPSFLSFSHSGSSTLLSPALTDREPPCPAPGRVDPLLGGDEKAFEKSHAEYQCRKPVVTTRCKTECRHYCRDPRLLPIWSASGLPRMRGRSSEPAPRAARMRHAAPPRPGRLAFRHLNLPRSVISSSRLLALSVLCFSCAGLCGDQLFHLLFRYFFFFLPPPSSTHLVTSF